MSSFLYIQKDEVEAFLFDGTLIKSGEWVVPEWVIEAIMSGTISYKDKLSLSEDYLSDSSCNCGCIQLGTESTPLANLKVSKIYFRYSEDEEPIKIDLSEESIYIINSGHKISVCRESEFNDKYVKIDTVESLERVDIPSAVPYTYKPLPVITGEWLYIPPCEGSKYYMIRCSNCGSGHKVKNVIENQFPSIISPWHFCSNCGAEMQNSNLPKRGGNNLVRS